MPLQVSGPPMVLASTSGAGPGLELLVRDTGPVTWLPPSSTGPWLAVSLTGPWKVFAGQEGASAGSVEASGPPPRSRVPVVLCAETGPDTVVPQTVRALAPMEVSGPLIVEFATYAHAPGRMNTGPPTVAPFTKVPELIKSGPGLLPLTVAGLFTVTVKVPETVPGVSSASVAEQVTVVVPMGKVDANYPNPLAPVLTSLFLTRLQEMMASPRRRRQR